MKFENCIVCGKRNTSRNNPLCCSAKCNIEMNKNSEYYYKKIEEAEINRLKYKIMLKNKLDELKDESLRNHKSSSYRGEATTHIIRNLTKGNKTGDAFGITLPKSIHMKYDRMVCESMSNGHIVLTPIIKSAKELYTYNHYKECPNSKCPLIIEKEPVFCSYQEGFEYCPYCKTKLIEKEMTNELKEMLK